MYIYTGYLWLHENTSCYSSIPVTGMLTFLATAFPLKAHFFFILLKIKNFWRYFYLPFCAHLKQPNYLLWFFLKLKDQLCLCNCIIAAAIVCDHSYWYFELKARIDVLSSKSQAFPGFSCHLCFSSFPNPVNHVHFFSVLSDMTWHWFDSVFQHWLDLCDWSHNRHV